MEPAKAGSAARKIQRLASLLGLDKKKPVRSGSFDSPTGFRDKTPSKESLEASPAEKASLSNTVEQALEKLLLAEAFLLRAEKQEKDAEAKEVALAKLRELTP